MYKISKYIKDYFRAFITPSFGSIKPAQKNLEEKGFVESRKSLSQGGKQYGYYSITQAGREELKKQILSPIPKNPVQFFANANIKISCASLLDKKETRKTEIQPDYSCFEIGNQFVVGYGLDYDGFYRNIPYIGYIET